MSPKKYLYHAIIALILAGAASLPAKGDLISYQYLGNTFDTVVGTPIFGSDAQMSITVQLDGPVTDGTVYSTDWLSWSMSAGSLSIGSAAGHGVMSLEGLWGGSGAPAYVTFSGGSIVSWNILGVDAISASPVYFVSWNSPPNSPIEMVQPVTWGGGSLEWSASVETVGTWSILEDGGGDSAVPEPGTLGLCGCGALLLLLRRRRAA